MSPFFSHPPLKPPEGKFSGTRGPATPPPQDPQHPLKVWHVTGTQYVSKCHSFIKHLLYARPCPRHWGHSSEQDRFNALGRGHGQWAEQGRQSSVGASGALPEEVVSQLGSGGRAGVRRPQEGRGSWQSHRRSKGWEDRGGKRIQQSVSLKIPEIELPKGCARPEPFHPGGSQDWRGEQACPGQPGVSDRIAGLGAHCPGPLAGLLGLGSFSASRSTQPLSG